MRIGIGVNFAGHMEALRVDIEQSNEMEWLPPSPDGIEICQDSGVRATERKGRQPGQRIQ